MKIGNYKFDSFWLSMTIGLLAVSLLFPYIIFSAIITTIFGLKKVNH